MFVIVLDALLRRKMIVKETGADAVCFVRANRRAGAAAADRHAAIHLAGHDRLTERDNVVGIVVVGIQAVRAEIHDFVSRRPDAGDQFFLQSKPTMIGGNSYAHEILSLFSRGGSVGDHQRLILSHTAGRDRRIGGE
jgi:hypothetical protein